MGRECEVKWHRVFTEDAVNSVGQRLWPSLARFLRLWGCATDAAVGATSSTLMVSQLRRCVAWNEACRRE